MDEWIKKATVILKGRKIVDVRYLGDDELKLLDWNQRAIVLQLDDGTLIFPSRDDEGNGAGALFTTHDKLPTIPVI